MNFFGKNIKLIVFVLFINTVVVYSQDKKMFSDAISEIESEQYNKAFILFQKILKNNPDNCNFNYMAGYCLFSQPDKKKESLPYFEKAIKNVSKTYKEASFKEVNAPTGAMLLYAISLQLNNKIEEAKEFYAQYKEQLGKKDLKEGIYLDQKIKSCDVAEELLKKPIFFKSQLLPEPIKSKKSEYKAVFNADETSMVFQSDRNGRQGLFYSQLKNGSWSYPFEITQDLQIDASNDKFSLCSMSADGLRLYTLIGDQYETNLYISTLEKNKWTNTKPLNRYINSINNQTFASESPDGKQLFFTSDRKWENYGNMDIYVSTLTAKNDWGPVKNIGKNINTPFNEENPFVSPDNNTLYFSSEGHNSMGGYDIFVSKRISETEWSAPENIGYPINTTDDNLFFVPSKEVNKGYYVLNPEEEPHIALVELNVKEEVPVEASKTKEEMANAITATTTVTDTLSKPVVELINKPEENKENKENLPQNIPQNLPQNIPQNQTQNISGAVTSNTSGVDHFTIQIAALSKVVQTSVFKNIEDVDYSIGKDSLVRYYWGYFDSKAEAGSKLGTVINKGYKDAFVVPVSKFYNDNNTRSGYTVQVCASFHEIDATRFKSLQDLRTFKCNDRYIRCTTGNFENYYDALKYLMEVMAKGYSDAFIRSFDEISKL
jgi:hypothetical protein